MFDMDEEPNNASAEVSGSPSPHSHTSSISPPPKSSSPIVSRSIPKPSALALSLKQIDNSPILSPPPTSSPPTKPDLANLELMRMHAGQTPTHRSPSAKGHY